MKKEEIEKSKDNQPMNTPKKIMEIKPTTSKSIVKIGSNNQTSSKILPGKNFIHFLDKFLVVFLISRNPSFDNFNKENQF